MRQCLLVWVAAVVFAGAVASAKAVAAPQPNATREVQLYLLADYSPGFPLTVSAPDLAAQLVSSQDVDCQQQLCGPCLKQQAVVMSHVTQLLSSPEASKSMVTATKCTGDQVLAPGVYSLQAGAVEGSREALWKCFQHHSNSSITEVELVNTRFMTQKITETRLLASTNSTSNNTEGSGEGSNTESAQGAHIMEAPSVELQLGYNYTCVAFYRPATEALNFSAAITVTAAHNTSATGTTPPSAVAANANNSDGQVAVLANASAVAPDLSAAVAREQPDNTSLPSNSNQTALAPPTLAALPPNETAANVSAGAATATPGVLSANATDILEVPAATSVPTVNATAVLPALQNNTVASGAAAAPASENQTITIALSLASSTPDASNSSTLSTDSMTFSTTDMTTDQTKTITVTFDPNTGEILQTGAETDATPTCPPLAYKQPPRGQPAPPLAAAGSRIIDAKTRHPVYIKGINWFGFNVDLGMLNGLWAGGTDAATDFSKIAYQLSQLGFNAVRLPFAHNYLAKTDVWDPVRNCTILSERDLKLRLTDPQDISYRTWTLDLPDQLAPMQNKDKAKCNTYLPTRSNTDRFLFVIQQFVALGMYVVLDYQPQGLEQHPNNLSQFVGAWKSLWQKVTCLPNFNSDIAGRVFIDVMNEPDSMGIKWESQGNKPGAEQLYLATADALWKMSPNKMIFMLEGTGQSPYGLNWGNGFITEKDVIKKNGLSDPTTFFKRLTKKPYAKSVVISPHLYPPSITKSTWLGANLWKQSNTSFAYLQYRGFCEAEHCTKFPIVIGEAGSALDSTKQDDSVWLQDFANFVMAKGAARTYNHQPLAGWMWWAYNENSGDTGGIVMNNWQDLNWVKLRYMINNLGLQPWYKQPTTTVRRRSGATGNGRVRVNNVNSGAGADRAGRRGQASIRRPHRRQGGHQVEPKQQQYVAPSWEELGFDIGTLPANS